MYLNHLTEAFVIVTRKRSGYMLLSYSQYLVNLLDLTTHLISNQPLSQVTFFLIAFVISVTAQPLNLPAETFPCGPSQLTCERWGYDACVSPDEEFYCLPCAHEYLKTLCGTKEEIGGCNLYCTKLAVDENKEEMQSDFTREVANLQANFSNERANLQFTLARDVQDLRANKTEVEKDLFSKLEISQKEVHYHEQRSKSLENELAEQLKNINSLKHKKTVLFVLLGLLLLLLLAISISFIIWCKKCRKRNKTSIDIENPEMSTLLADKRKNTATLGYLDTTELGDKTIEVPDASETAIQIVGEDTINACKNDLNHANIEQDENCLGDNFAGYAKFQMISPTDGAGSDKHKLAIQKHDHECPKNNLL